MFRRKILDKIIYWIDHPKIIILKGSRQVGKTTLLFLIQDYLKIHKNITNEQIVYISADALPQAIFLQTPGHLIEYLKTEHNLGKKKLYVFIDEFQYIKNAGLFLKNIFDQYKQEIQLFVSGSSSLEIAKNTEFLTGRKIVFDIYSLSFREYIATQTSTKFNQEFTLPDLIKKQKKTNMFLELYERELNLHFSNYIQWGGYPEIHLPENQDVIAKRRVLQDIISTYLEKDIANFLKIENIEAFNNLAKLLAGQIGNLVNRHELANTLDITNETTTKYITVLEETFVIKRVKAYYTNIRKELSRMPKVYFNDLGLRNLLIQQTLSPEIIPGNVIENFVFNELSRQIQFGSIKFYRTLAASEIDFIVEIGGKLLPIEVKHTNKKPTQPIIMKNFKNNYKKEVGQQIVITKNHYEVDGDVLFVPAILLPFIQLEK